MFKSALRKINSRKCLFFCEMHAWEKALVYARNTLGCQMSLFGYQSGTVSRMLLNYFESPVTFSFDGSYPLPLPSKIVCNGVLPHKYMLESGWPKEKILMA